MQRLTRIELIHTANPFKSSLGNIVQRNQVEVTWKAVNGAYPDFVESPKEILCDGNWFLEAVFSDIRHVCGWRYFVVTRS